MIRTKRNAPQRMGNLKHVFVGRSKIWLARGVHADQARNAGLHPAPSMPLKAKGMATLRVIATWVELRGHAYRVYRG
jgi:hypothetical protein